MILIHRLRGEALFINEDLIESIEARPDTVVTLVDGRELVIADTPDEVVERARRYRASVLVAVEDLRRRGEARLVPVNPTHPTAIGDTGDPVGADGGAGNGR